MSLRNFFQSLFVPRVHAEEAAEEEEVVDPQAVLRDKCSQKEHIASLWGKFQECNDRVNSRTKTTETCHEELFDYVAELDHCVAHNLWAKLK